MLDCFILQITILISQSGVSSLQILFYTHHTYFTLFVCVCVYMCWHLSELFRELERNREVLPPQELALPLRHNKRDILSAWMQRCTGHSTEFGTIVTLWTECLISQKQSGALLKVNLCLQQVCAGLHLQIIVDQECNENIFFYIYNFYSL